MSDKHLKSKQYYTDLYDRHTVDICRRTEKSSKEDKIDPPFDDEASKEEALRVKKWAHDLYLYVEIGERYANKEKTIQKWMDDDRKKDELYESTEPPEDIRCLTCRNRLKVTFKELWSEMDKEDRVLFMYECPNKCLPHRTFFSDGEEWRQKPNLCPECDTPLSQKSDDKGDKLVTTSMCPKCNYTKTDELVWTRPKEEEVDENFAKDRDRFCLTEEEGKKYLDEKWRMEQMGRMAEEWKEEQKRRDEKLKANPKGFNLEGAGYTCAICRDNTPEGDNWYDEYGIKCLICQKAIDEGEIPATLASDKDSWYSKRDLESKFGLKAPTIRKWIKEGILKARTVSHYGNGVHVEVFLIEDNKDFLPPKKLVESKMVKTREDGKDWYSSREWYCFVDPHKYLKDYKIMNYLRVVPPEEMKAREEAEKKRREERMARRRKK